MWISVWAFFTQILVMRSGLADTGSRIPIGYICPRFRFSAIKWPNGLWGMAMRRTRIT
uniref:Secreted protein n=1 Tax=Parastrongyloides trichosuri TaxID=131310 RepID=A0A0N5A0N0_PARTI